MIEKLKNGFNKLKTFIKKVFAPVVKLKNKVSSRFVKYFPDKKTFNLANIIAGLVCLLLFFVTLSSLILSPEETGSYYSTANSPNAEDSEDNPNDEIVIESELPPGLKGVSHSSRVSGDDPRPIRRKRASIKYRGTQVLVRSNSQGGRALPVGTNFIGKLLSQVDTRHSDKFVRVSLPFGGKFRDRMGVPKNTILLGSVSYSGSGKRVFLNFHTGILPNGEEIKIEATAMDSKDFSPGLIGSYHSAFGNRAGATLGFSFVSGASDVLQEKEALGQAQIVTKKATMKNALLNGISEFSKTEGAFQLEQARNDGAYVTIEQGKELLITLTKTFKNGGETQ